MSQKTFAIALMDPPYESENLTTAFRILDVMAQRGHNINVFAYEGASGLASRAHRGDPGERRELRGRGAGRTRAHHRWVEADPRATHGQRRGRSHREAQDPGVRHRGGFGRARHRAR